MIRLTKGPEPQVLLDNAAAWTADLLARSARGEAIPSEIWRRYAHPTVKKQSVADSHGKCIYCESKVRHISHGDIEHMKPKAPFPPHTYEWDNLGFVCSKCNGAKGDRYDEAHPPINPFTEDPGDFLVAIGELVWARPANDRGTITVDLVQLNRAELIEQRRRRLETVRALVDLVHRVQSAAVKEVYMSQLREELSDKSEYAFVARATAAALTPD